MGFLSSIIGATVKTVLTPVAVVKDAIGDIMVTLIIQCKMQGMDLQDCLESAYNVIKNRTGKMVDGVFVKD